MRSLFVLLILIICFSSILSLSLNKNEAHKKWKQFKKNFLKSYKNEATENKRFKIFESNLDFVMKHNEKFKNGEVSFEVAINEYSDFSDEEIMKKRGGWQSESSEPLLRKSTLKYQSPENVTVPDYFNWIDKGAVNPVKNQGGCGSCYAFSYIGALEGQVFLKTGKLIKLSEQNIIDCSQDYNNHGCHGGSAGRCYKYALANGGIATSESYPYEAKEGTCRFNTSMKGATVIGHVNLPKNDEQKLKEAVATVGPIGTGIYSKTKSFHQYKGGIYYDPECLTGEHRTHAVVIVGYGTDLDTKEDYWLVRNSWGPNWGLGGYIKMARNRNSHCLIAKGGRYPVVDNST